MSVCVPYTHVCRQALAHSQTESDCAFLVPELTLL